MYVDDDDFGWHEDPEDHDEVYLREPFRTLFSLKATRRYDLRAKLANRLGVPRGVEMRWGTTRFVDALYTVVSEAWEMGAAEPTESRARGIVKQVLFRIDFDDVRDIYEDFGWAETREVRVHVHTLEADVSAAAVTPLSRPVVRLLEKARRASRAAA